MADLIGTVWINADAKAAIEGEARRWRIRETGGPLFGYEASDGDLVVTQAFGPGPKATHRKLRLIPDREHTQRLIDEIFEESGGRRSYLGEWHTHPAGRARPSGRDVETLMDIASEEAVDLARPVALIQQTHPIRRRVKIGELAAFCWDDDEQRVSRLELVMSATS